MGHEQQMGVVAARRLKHAVARVLEHRERELAHQAIILDNKHGLARFGHLPTTSLRPANGAGARTLPASRPNSAEKQVIQPVAITA